MWRRGSSSQKREPLWRRPLSGREGRARRAHVVGGAGPASHSHGNSCKSWRFLSIPALTGQAKIHSAGELLSAGTGRWPSRTVAVPAGAKTRSALDSLKWSVLKPEYDLPTPSVISLSLSQILLKRGRKMHWQHGPQAF